LEGETGRKVAAVSRNTQGAQAEAGSSDTGDTPGIATVRASPIEDQTGIGIGLLVEIAAGSALHFVEQQVSTLQWFREDTG
jgi:hypothetical protein